MLVFRGTAPETNADCGRSPSGKYTAGFLGFSYRGKITEEGEVLDNHFLSSFSLFRTTPKNMKPSPTCKHDQHRTKQPCPHWLMMMTKQQLPPKYRKRYNPLHRQKSGSARAGHIKKQRPDAIF